MKKIPKEIKDLLHSYKEIEKQITQLGNKINHLTESQEPFYIKIKEFEYGCKVGDIITDENNVKWKVTGFELYWLEGHKIKKNGELYKFTNRIYDFKQKYDLGLE